MSFGYDPELFAMAKHARKYATSAHLVADDEKLRDTLTVSRSNERMQELLHNRVTMKTDGFALELNCRPETCRDRLVPYTGMLLQDWYSQYGDEFKLDAIPVRPLNQDSLKGELPQGVVEFGCLPDRNAYTLEEKTPFRSDYHNNERYLGGHLHMTTSHHLIPSDLYKAGLAIWLDVYLGMAFVSLLGHINDYGEEKRREYYGQAGSYRDKSYGIEYRVLSGAVMMSPVLLYWAIGRMRNAQANFHTALRNQAVANQTAFQRWMQNLHQKWDFKAIQEIINHHLVKDARAFYEKHGIKGYEDNFLALMVRADDNDVPLETNFATAWGLSEKIRDHGYFGCESLMSIADDRFANNVKKADVFPPAKLIKYMKDGMAW